MTIHYKLINKINSYLIEERIFKNVIYINYMIINKNYKLKKKMRNMKDE